MHPKIARLLSAAAISYVEYRHADLPFPINSPADFAHALGRPLEHITKSVFFRVEPTKTFSLAISSVNRKINMKQFAALAGGKRVQLASEDELKQFTDYPSRGVSPLGLDTIPVFLDKTLLDFSTILIGGGEIGVEIE
ncbi:MAG TPA: YbaK/EbsC family protein, partial [Ktedonobacteraceae bacterium]|nr:YbaK/EbsC family protein [Ktedonobacteraceae bacterium]